MTVLNDSKFMSQRILLKFKLRFGKTSEATVIENVPPTNYRGYNILRQQIYKSFFSRVSTSAGESVAMAVATGANGGKRPGAKRPLTRREARKHTYSSPRKHRVVGTVPWVTVRFINTYLEAGAVSFGWKVYGLAHIRILRADTLAIRGLALHRS